jgi:peptide/nickel transport system ATP-binding protein
MTNRVHLEQLTVQFPGGSAPAVADVSFDIEPGECFALVGESGSGKTLTALSLLGLTPPDALVTAKSRVIAGVETREFTQSQWRTLRGTRVGLVSQDALVSLDPLRRIGTEVGEVLDIARPRLEEHVRMQQVLAALEQAAVSEPHLRMQQYAHQLSGGLRQRALIASAIAAKPAILIADEPTTALDSLSRARILELLGQLKASGIALLLVSHDIAVVRQIADRIGVMRHGELVEKGPADEILTAPRHPYTRELLDLVPTVKTGAPRNTSHDDPSESPVLLVRGVSRHYATDEGAVFHALQDVSLQVSAGRTLGIVGESGSGKTTLARIVMGIDKPDSGDVELMGKPWSSVSERLQRPQRGAIQLVEQNPYDALDPRWSVKKVIGEAIRLDDTLTDTHQRSARMRELLEQVGLSEELLPRKPHQLSGGQRQRVAIARALARRPSVLVCDEPVSALDASVQAQVLRVLASLQERLALSLIVISHDLGVIAQMSDEVVVLHEGRVVESGNSASVITDPQHPFTRELLAAAPAMMA